MPRSPLGLPVLHLIHYVCMPSPLPRQVRGNRFAQYCSLVVGLPQITVGSAPALSVSRPAQRSLALQPADSPSRLMRPSTPEAPAALLPPPPLRLLPGGAIQFPGGFISRCGPVPFTAHRKRLIYKRGCQEHFSPSAGCAGLFRDIQPHHGRRSSGVLPLGCSIA